MELKQQVGFLFQNVQTEATNWEEQQQKKQRTKQPAGWRDDALTSNPHSKKNTKTLTQKR